MAAPMKHNKALFIITDALYDPYTVTPEFVSRLKKLIPYFRRDDRDIIWIRSQWPEITSQKMYAVDKAGDLIEKTKHHNYALDRTPQGPQIYPELHDMVDEAKDLIITKDFYSAFERTPLLEALRKKMILDVYFCGWLINVGIYSSAADAVGHGLHITIIKDCIASRSKEAYEKAMSGLVEIMDAAVVDSEGVMNELGGVPVPDIDIPLHQLSLNIAEHTTSKGR